MPHCINADKPFDIEMNEQTVPKNPIYSKKRLLRIPEIAFAIAYHKHKSKNIQIQRQKENPSQLKRFLAFFCCGPLTLFGWLLLIIGLFGRSLSQAAFFLFSVVYLPVMSLILASCFLLFVNGNNCQFWLDADIPSVLFIGLIFSVCEIISVVHFDVGKCENQKLLPKYDEERANKIKRRVAKYIRLTVNGSFVTCWTLVFLCLISTCTAFSTYMKIMNDTNIKVSEEDIFCMVYFSLLAVFLTWFAIILVVGISVSFCVFWVCVSLGYLSRAVGNTTAEKLFENGFANLKIRTGKILNKMWTYGFYEM